MANFLVSPNMGLPVPTPGVDPGPDYATNLSNSLTIVDGHNHSAGSGVQINPNGLNINSDLPINGNNLTLVNTVNFLTLVSPLAGTTPNLGCVYVAGNELYYNDEAGNVVQITNTGSVNAGAGSITGLPSGTASATYSSGAKTFIWQSSTLTPANMDGASFIFRNLTASSFGVTVSAPAALAFDYNITWPLPPGSTSFLTIDSNGNMGTTLTTTLADSVASTMTTTGVNLIANERTRATGTTVAAGGVAISGSSGSFGNSSTSYVQITNQSVTITTTGRPVMIKLIADGLGSASFAFSNNSIQETSQAKIGFFNGVTLISEQLFGDVVPGGSGGQNFVPSSSFSYVDFPIAGTYTYTAQGKLFAGTSYGVTGTALCVYEL